MSKRVRGYSLTTLDHRLLWWCGGLRKWVPGDEVPIDEPTRKRLSTHRQFRTLKQALTEAALLLLQGVTEIYIQGRRIEWRFAFAAGRPAEQELAWARRYLSQPRKSR